MGRPDCLTATKQEYRENIALSTSVQQCSERGDSPIPASDFGKDGSGEGNSALLVFLTVDLTGASSVWSPRERSQSSRQGCQTPLWNVCTGLLARSPAMQGAALVTLARVVAVVKYAVRTTRPAFLGLYQNFYLTSVKSAV